MPARVTLRAIADRAQVHISTVSLALRDSPKLRPEMRERIQKVATALGYVPDAALAALVAYRKGVRTAAYQSTLGWIDNWPVEHGGMRLREVSTFNEYFLGAARRAEDRGYRLEEFSLHRPASITPARLAAILRSRNIQGLVVAPQKRDGAKLDLDFSGFSAVALGYSLRPASLHIVTNHQFLSATQIVARLRELGYRRIGLYLHSDWDNKVNHGYVTGFTTAQQALRPRDRIAPCLPDEIGAENFLNWFQRARPDAVVTQGITREMIGWLKPLGIRVPRDVGLVNLSAHRELEPEISGIYQNDFLIGATAVDFVIGMLQRNERGVPPTIIYTLVDGVWHLGATVRRLTPAT